MAEDKPAKRRRLQVGPETARALQMGHPWVIADRYTRAWPKTDCGDLAELIDEQGALLGTALLDPTARICARLLSRTSLLIDEAFLQQRFAAAAEGRRWIDRGDTDVWRMVNGEADGLPGLTIDRYADFVLVQYYTMAWERYLKLVARTLLHSEEVRGVYAKYRPQETRKIAAGKGSHGAGGRLVAGKPAPEDLTVVEHGLHFAVDLVGDLHTGIFPDQRHNRLALRARAAGCDLLNLFAYTGAFSVAAAAGGGRRVTSVDASARYLAQARRNFQLNDIPVDEHEFIVGDCFAELDQMARNNRRFDIILMDPPSFSSTRHSRFTTGGGTASLVTRSLRLLAPDGLLVTSSNLQKMPLAEYLKELRKGALEADRNLQVIEVGGQGPDFPFLPNFPEGQYLKYVVSVVKEKF